MMTTIQAWSYLFLLF